MAVANGGEANRVGLGVLDEALEALDQIDGGIVDGGTDAGTGLEGWRSEDGGSEGESRDGSGSLELHFERGLDWIWKVEVKSGRCLVGSVVDRGTGLI